MKRFDPSACGPVVAEMLKDAAAMPLDAGAPDAVAGDRLRDLNPGDLFSGTPVADSDKAAACLSALWLQHGFLDESHRISQRIPTAEGSFWHGIMHRREGDYPNAKYWFRRVGDHPVFASLQSAARDIAVAGDGPAARAVAAQSAWDPGKFIDLCEISVANGKPGDLLWSRVQQAEWEILFSYCWSGAIGK